MVRRQRFGLGLYLITEEHSVPRVLAKLPKVDVGRDRSHTGDPNKKFPGVE